MTLRRFNLYLNLTFVFPCACFILLLCVPLVDTSGTAVQKTGAYVLAATFWICSAMEAYFIRKCTRERIKLKKKYYNTRQINNANVGAISFFSSFEAAVADIVFIVTAVLTAVFICIRLSSGFMVIGCMATLFLSFVMHCQLNGKNYRYKKAFYKHQKERKSNE